MAPKRSSLQRKAVPRPINVPAADRLSIDPRPTALGSATQVITPPATPLKSSLRNRSKTPSPEIKRVGWSLNASPTAASGPRTVRHGSREAGAKSTTRTTKSTSPRVTTRMSPRTAKKFDEIVDHLTKFTDELIKTPPPTTTKTRTFKGVKVGTGSPVYSPNDNDRVIHSPESTADKTQHPTPPASRQNSTNGKVNKGKKVTSITRSDGRTETHVEQVSEWLQGPMPPHISVHDGTDNVVEIPTKAMLDQMQYFKHTKLRPLSLEEIHIQFYLLQKMLRQFSKKFFLIPWSTTRASAFHDTFADLAADHPAFVRMLNYIADGSRFRDGWADFLSSEHTRPHIVYAVLGEWLKYNVFGHTCLGLSAAEDALMRDIDVLYLHYDGFVRTKERAKLLHRILANKPKWECDVDVSAAVDRVVADLLVVLTPLLPADCPGTVAELTATLTTLVDLAANLHLCIRLTGIDGTILRYHSSRPGDPFAYAARQNCVNKASVTETLRRVVVDERGGGSSSSSSKESLPAGEEFSPRHTDKLRIRMPCFPLVVAVVPYGPTLRDFAVEQALYERVVRSADLPAVNDPANGPMYIEDVPAEIVRASCFEELPESCRRDYGDRDGGKKSKAFGSYVRQYTLNEADVYCEWEFGDEGDAVSLQSAVGDAYGRKYPNAMWWRCLRRTAGIVAVTGVTMGAAGAAVYGMYRVGDGLVNHTPLGRAAVAAVKGLKLPVNISPQDVKAVVAKAIAIAKTRTQPLRKVYKVTKNHAQPYLDSVVRRSRPFRMALRSSKDNSIGWTRSQPASVQSAARNLTSGFSSSAANVSSLAINLTTEAISKVDDLTGDATSILNEAVLPDEAVRPTPTSGLFGGLLRPISVGVRKTPVKLGFEIGKFADPITRVSKTKKTAVAEQVTEVAKTVAKKWYEYLIRGG